jgi:hypothetical protein
MFKTIKLLQQLCQNYTQCCIQYLEMCETINLVYFFTWCPKAFCVTPSAIFLKKIASRTHSDPNSFGEREVLVISIKGKAVPLHAMEALGGRGGIAPTHSQPRH